MQSMRPCGVDIHLQDTPARSGVKRERESGQNDTVIQKDRLELKKRKMIRRILGYNFLG